MSGDLKKLSKEVAQAAQDLKASKGMEEEQELTEASNLLFLVCSALNRLESVASTYSSTEAETEELLQASKRARKLLRGFLPTGEANPAIEHKGLDLGQYAHTEVFDGNTKKAEKFARLMGGAKGEPHKHHTTFAADSSSVKKVVHEIEDQFTAALQHKGKKGLGSS
jgi:hypothetical protein